MKNSVRNSLLTLAAVVVCGLSVMTSCSKDDSYENLIVGTWDLVKQQVTISATGSELVDPMTLTQDVKTEQTTVTIKADGTWSSTSISEKGKKSEGAGTWSIKDGKLNIATTSGDGPGVEDETIESMNIDSLTAKEMVLSYADSYEEDGVTYNAKAVMTFKKR